ncbi:MAG: choice-of-anchor Q domain-containing protein [bacterium]
MAAPWWRAAIIAAHALVVAAAAPAATFLVDRRDDPPPQIPSCTPAPNDCSLREAIRAANSLAGADEIDLGAPDASANAPYALTRAGEDDAALVGDLDITGPLTIRGVSSTSTVIDAGTLPAESRDRVFDIVANAAVEIADLSIRGGLAPTGGGIRNAGDLTLTDAAVAGNESSGGLATDGYAYGGGVHTLENSSLTVVRGSISENVARGRTLPGDVGAYAYGGGVCAENGASVVLEDVTLSDNQALGDGGDGAGGGGGGAIATFQASLKATGCTIQRNTARGGSAARCSDCSAFGGGIAVLSFGVGSLALGDSTVLENVAQAGASTERWGGDAFGGGIYVDAPAVIEQTRIEGNLAHAGDSGDPAHAGGEAFCGGIDASLELTLRDSTLRDNRATGGSGPIEGGDAFSGGLCSDGNAVIERVLVEGNQTEGGTGAVAGGDAYCAGLAFDGLSGSAVSVEASAVVGNRAAGGASPGAVTGTAYGAGICIRGIDDATITNTTITRNEASLESALEIFQQDPEGAVLLAFSTVTGNTSTASAPIGVDEPSALVLRGSLLGDACAGAGSFASEGGNVERVVGAGPSTCGLGVAGDATVNDLALAPLGDHGGPTPTLPPLPTSPALARVAGCPPPSLDQRGSPRGAEVCDAGAVEVQAGEDFGRIFESSFESGELDDWSAVVGAG